MKKINILIAKNSNKYPDMSEFSVLMRKAEQNIMENPDISIECSKALIESTSKTILKELSLKGYIEKDFKKKNFDVVFKEALEALSSKDSTVEDRFLKSCLSLTNEERNFSQSSKALCQSLAEIRNARGDISHGKILPKKISSDPKFSRLIYRVTLGIVHYLLETFYNLDLDNPELLYDAEETVEFNQMLDEENPFPDNLLYSKSLFEQRFQEYEFQFSEFLLSKETEKETDDSGDSVTLPAANSVRNISSTTVLAPNNYWQPKTEEKLTSFCQKHELDFKKTKSLLETYFLTWRDPLIEDVAHAMLNLPSILERKAVVGEVRSHILGFLEEMIKEVNPKK